MKTFKILTIILLMLSAVLTGCKDSQPKTTSEDSAYPASESYPVANVPANSSGDTAYPVFPIDATQLTKVPAWTLTKYSINGQEESTSTKTFTFALDGNYTLTTDSGLVEGHWYITTQTQPILVLITGAEQDLNYEIINLSAESMVLNIEQDNTLIEEQYQPAD